MRPRNRKTITLMSNRSITLPIRRANQGEKVAIRIRNKPYTICNSSEKEMDCSISRDSLKAAGFDIVNGEVKC